MTRLFRARPLAVLALLLAVAATAYAGGAVRTRPAAVAAAGASGTVTGQVIWCAAYPFPYAPGADGAPAVGAPSAVGADDQATATPDESSPNGMPGSDATGRPQPPIIRPIRPIPAGAVLVAVQGTSLNTRTDETGHFRIEGLPLGQYLTLAAGPVANASTAIAVRPNVFVERDGQTLDLGRLSLGQPCYIGPVPATADGSGAPAAP